MDELFRDNLLSAIVNSADEETVQTIQHGHGVRIERIVSTGQSSPPGFWYDQDEHEWVALISGEAKLRFEDDDTILHLRSGDHVMINAHRRHRVEWTATETLTVWIAVFYKNRPGET
ncbi:cupin domain-containing protein [Aporhodopirellula aestuarii]|uniref:Cupin n=1 Tax=Aporhodopirellula aestuarii TaxID=2950107 RepID=A0ABT0U7N8_9BACT|nr:cupin domain-containing protein [Aporhodopirellula aestuarii]MCM2372957.1 cupin [Aporhodopirellula aestuarii]